MTEAVRRKPYSVVLFDEVEKAHVDVMTTLLQVLDDGRLTDGQGRVVDFSNTVIILTSNLGARFLLEEKSDAISDATREKVMATVRNHFLPEFLNRLDDIVIFTPLNKKELREIVKLAVKSIGDRLKERDIDVIVEDSAADLIVQESYDPHMGARPMRRFTEKQLVTQISRMLISESLVPHSILSISASGQKFLFNVRAKEAMPAAAKRAKNGE